MRMGTKVFLIIVALLGLIQTVWFAALVYPIPNFTRYILPFREVAIIGYIGLGFAILSALVFLGILLVAIFRRRTTNKLSFQTNKGQLNIDKQAVAKTIKHTVATEYPVRDVDVNVQLAKNKQAAISEVTAYVTDPNDMVDTSAAIKKSVQRQLKEALGIPAKKVTVNLHLASENKRVARVV
ncbi:alkaline shock response membrane anchor protein AmaP [Agrilactobacillus fermenti]|uniref:alkaline shock response membrane anchor protein AmaP n=1 Tax=Agrilactobacillus fermenti TaxID=2586909 RepID=UPI003A5C6AA8